LVLNNEKREFSIIEGDNFCHPFDKGSRKTETTEEALALYLSRDDKKSGLEELVEEMQTRSDYIRRSLSFPSELEF